MDATMEIEIKGSMTATTLLKISWNTSDNADEICFQIGEEENHLYVNFDEVKAVIDSIACLKNKN